jgi:hypothetical protein
MSIVGRGNVDIAIGQPLAGTLAIGVKTVGCIGLVFPDNLAGRNIHLHNCRPVAFRAFRSIIKKLNTIFPQPCGIMVPEDLLVAVVIKGRGLSLAIGAGIAPAIEHLAGLVVNDIKLTEITGI